MTTESSTTGSMETSNSISKSFFPSSGCEWFRSASFTRRHFMGITQKDLDQAFTEFQPRLGGHKNDYFPLLYLAAEFGGKPLDYEQQVAFGNHDYGFDAFHID